MSAFCPSVRFLLAVLFLGSLGTQHGFVLAQSGTQVGSPFGFSRSNVTSRPRAIAVSLIGTPFVAWDSFNTDNGSSRAYVSVFDGNDWIILGDQFNTFVQNVVVDDLEIDSLGRPVVAWSASMARFSQRRVWVTRWENDQWMDLAGPINAPSDRSAFGVQLELGPFDSPVVVWNERFGTPSIEASFARMWNGQQWLPMGQDGQLPFQVRDLEIKFRPDGRPVIYAAVAESSQGPFGRADSLCLYRFNGVRWRRMPGKIEKADSEEIVFALDVDLEMQANNRPWLYWTEGPAPSKTPWLARYNGGTWQYVDTTDLPAGESLVIRGNRQPVVGRRDSPDLRSSLQFFKYGPTFPVVILGQWRQRLGGGQPGINLQVVGFDKTIFTAVWDRDLNETPIVVRRH